MKKNTGDSGIDTISGIDIIGGVPWGTHFCQFYQTKEDLLDILIPYFKAGLENKEFCVWITSQFLEVKEAEEALRKSVPDFDTYLEKRQIEIIGHNHWCVKEDFFDSENTMDMWFEKLSEALTNGYNGLRLTEDTSWIKKENWNDFTGFVEKLDNILGNNRIVALCTYSLDRCNTAEIINVAINHQLALIKENCKWERIEKRLWGKNITGCKQAEKVQLSSEQLIGVELESIPSPMEVVENLELADIVDTRAIQSIMEDFYNFAHIAMALVDLKGNVLVSVGWQDICTKFHRVHPEACKYCMESDTKLSAGIPPGEYKLYRCRNSMWDIATPVFVNSQHIGNIFSGQFFFEDELLDYELFRSQARKYGFNEEEYIKAVEKVPRLSRGVVDAGMAFLMTFANMLSQLSYNNIRLTQSLEERDTLVNALRKSKERFRLVLENSLDAAYRQNLQTNSYDYMSPAVEKITGFSAQEMNAMSVSGVLERIHPDDRPLVVAELAQAFDIGFGTFEYRFKCKDSQYRWFADRFTVSQDQSGIPLFSSGIVRDITGSKKAQEALKNAHENLEEKIKERTAELEKACISLKESEKGLAEAQKMAHIGNWNWNLVTGESYWSDEVFRIFGRSPQESGATYDEFLNYVHPADRGYVDNAVKKALNEKHIGIDYRIVLANGEERTVHAQSEVVFNEKNIPIRVKGTVQDITERKRAEEALRESEARLRRFYESSMIGVFYYNLDGLITDANDKLLEIAGYTREDLQAGRVDWDKMTPPEYRHLDEHAIEELKTSGMNAPYEKEYIRKDGSRISVMVGSATFDQVHNEGTAFVLDITEKKKAEDALANIEITRKKEIHHRIKNNLQVISSLLDLQANKFDNLKVIEAFKESQNRVISMALIHEELYKGKGTDTLDFCKYLQELAENLFQTYSLSSKNINLKMDLEKNAFFDMDIAVPLGIIVNELISNSLKHAFPGRDRGEIRIKLCKEEKGECKKEGNQITSFILTVSDNGVGIPENLDIQELDSLGIQLITTLADQLDGNLELKRDKGTEFSIRFTVAEYYSDSVPVL